MRQTSKFVFRGFAAASDPGPTLSFPGGMLYEKGTPYPNEAAGAFGAWAGNWGGATNPPAPGGICGRS